MFIVSTVFLPQACYYYGNGLFYCVKWAKGDFIMTVEVIKGENYITVILNGELDHHNAAAAREIIDARLEQLTPKLCILDFSGVSFMDSSGIGLILGRKRRAESFGGDVRVKNPSRYAEKIIRLAGLQNMILPEKVKM